MKICKQCREEKPLSEYYKYTDGYYFGKCISCHKTHVLTTRDSEKHKIYNSRYSKSVKGKKQKALWWKDKGKVLDKHRNLSEERKEFYRQRQRERDRFKKDPEYYRLKSTARRHNTVFGVLRYIKERDVGCRLCGRKSDLQFDHIFPESLGGKGSKSNLQMLCGKCNRFKSNNLLLPEGGMLIVSSDLKRRLVGVVS